MSILLANYNHLKLIIIFMLMTVRRLLGRVNYNLLFGYNANHHKTLQANKAPAVFGQGGATQEGLFPLK